jgi:hypothetical protein
MAQAVDCEDTMKRANVCTCLTWRVPMPRLWRNYTYLNKRYAR